MPRSGFDCAARTHVGLRRKLNEDALLLRNDQGLWAIADGMGGHHAGDVASAIVVDALGACPPGDASAMSAFALAALDQANTRLIALADSGPERRTMGSTVVGLVADERGFSCFWAGDSRAYRLRGQDFGQITHDHSLVQDLVDAGMLEASEAESHPNANVVTRAVGATDYLKVETVSGPIMGGDTFLLASDGLTRLVQPAELHQHVALSDLEVAADALLQLALARGGNDNISLIVIRAR